MNNRRRVIFGALIIVAGLIIGAYAYAVCSDDHPPPIQTKPTKPWHVTEMKEEGFPRCGAGTWMFDISWKPVLKDNQPWSNYNVAGYKCTKSKYSCTAERCYAEISGCSTRMSGTWAAVAASFAGKSGMRLGTIFKSCGCK
jgi:hypothetical protein